MTRAEEAAKVMFNCLAEPFGWKDSLSIEPKVATWETAQDCVKIPFIAAMEEALMVADSEK